MEKQKCPELRFNGYSESWEIKELREICSYHTSSLTVNDARSKGQYKLYDANDCIGYTTENIQYSEYITIIKDGSGVGRVKVLPKETSFIATMGAITVKNQKDDLNFIYYQLQRIDFSKHILGATIPHVYFSSYGSDSYPIPCGKEQIAISRFLQNLDQSIALHEKKLTQTQNLKKAMLEKMFPKAGSTQPEIRLKGFSGEWDTINLGSLCYIGDIDHRMPESNTSGIPYLMTGDFFGINGLDFKNAKLISNQDYEQLSKKIKPVMGDILFARYASVGTVRLVVTDVKFLISYSCAILKTSVSSNGEYLFYWFQTSFAQNQIEQEINTGSQRNIGIDSLKKLSVSLPKTSEQKAIANFFKKLDETLALQQQQFQTLKNLKQAFLEKMFV